MVLAFHFWGTVLVLTIWSIFNKQNEPIAGGPIWGIQSYLVNRAVLGAGFHSNQAEVISASIERCGSFLVDMKTGTRAGSLRIWLEIGIWFLFLNIVQPEQWAESKRSHASCDRFESSECIGPIETFSSVDKRLRLGKSHCKSAITEGSHEMHAGCWQKKNKISGWGRVSQGSKPGPLQIWQI